MVAAMPKRVPMVTMCVLIPKSRDYGWGGSDSVDWRQGAGPLRTIPIGFGRSMTSYRWRAASLSVREFVFHVKRVHS